MKTLILGFALLSVASAVVIKCYVGDNADKAKATDCTDNVDKCAGPAALVPFTPTTDGAYGCGPCAVEATNCLTCTGAECNKPVEYTDFECKTHEYVLADKEWKEKEDSKGDVVKVKCQTAKDKEAECNKPGSKALAGTVPPGTPQFCGHCSAAAITAETCVNSASTFTAVLAVVAIFYNLL